MDMTHTPPSDLMPDNYDRLLAQLEGLPDVTRTKQAIVRVIPSFGVGGSETFIVQTIRQRGAAHGKSQDTIFLEHVIRGRAYRLVMPADVADIIARQRDQLTAINRRKGARAAVATRQERGMTPAFLKNPHRGRRTSRAGTTT